MIIMGLIKAIGGAVGGVLADQWKEYFYCDSLPADVLVRKGRKRTSSRSTNVNGEENIISNGSLISVNEGQCMIIVEQGKVVELCAEAGEFKYDSSTEPSIFEGGLGKGIIDSFKTVGKRFTFGGDTAKDQRVYYFNTKEITGNKYGTPSPVPFRVVYPNLNLDTEISIRCNGEYSYKIVDPIMFYTNVCGNVTSDYNRGQIDSMLKTELLSALQPAFAKISDMGIRYSALPGHTTELCNAMNEVLSEQWKQKRGITIFSIGVNSVNASPEDEERLKNVQTFANPTLAAAHLAGAQAQAMRDAAKNPNGAMNGFFGMGMAQNMGGNIQGLYNMGAQQQPAQPVQQDAPAAAPTAGGWDCACGKKGNTGKFCAECGQPKPAEEEGWKCSCGAVNKGKFCAECGAKKPADAPLYRCDKCGWEPEDPKNPPKFCPECGDKFDENDIK